MRSIQHCFTNEKSCLNNSVNFFDEVTGLVDKVRVEAVFCLNCSSAYNTLPYNSFIEELLMDEETVKKIENCRDSLRSDSGDGQHKSGCMPVTINIS